MGISTEARARLFSELEGLISKLAKKWPKWTEISDYVRNQERLEFVSYLYAAEADFSRKNLGSDAIALEIVAMDTFDVEDVATSTSKMSPSRLQAPQVQKQFLLRLLLNSLADKSYSCSRVLSIRLLDNELVQGSKK